MENLIWELYLHGAIRLGKYRFKGGLESLIYVDMRRVILYPKLLKKVALEYSEAVQGDYVAGVPIGGLHLATAVSLNLNKPMLIPRPKKKEYGLGKTIESDFLRGQSVCIIEDVVTSGKSLAEIEELFTNEGLKVISKICFLSYFNRNSDLKSLTNLEQILNVLESKQAIDKDLSFKILRGFRFRAPACLVQYPRIFQKIVEEKKSLLIIALDVSWKRVQDLIPLLAPYAVAFKFHYDLLYQEDRERDFSPFKLMNLAKQYNFLVIRDRKYGDVAKVNKRIAGPEGKTQHLNIVHLLPGNSALPDGKNIVLLDMSTKGNLFTPSYRKQVLQKTLKDPRVVGYISQHRWWDSEKLCFTPGIDLAPRVEISTSQFYSSPSQKREDGSDMFIVGSAIYNSSDPVKEARKYRKATWNPEIEKIGAYCYAKLRSLATPSKLAELSRVHQSKSNI